MTVVRIQPPAETPHLYEGLSTDEKPGLSPLATGEAVPKIPLNSKFRATDTDERWIWHGSWPWVREEPTLEATLRKLVDLTQDLVNIQAATHKGHEEHLWEEDVEIESYNPDEEHKE